MTPPNDTPERETLRVTRLIRAPRSKVFDAFVTPEIRRKWWFPEEGMECDLCEIDARPGGRYRVNMKDPRGEELREYVCSGEFLEVDSPVRLVFSWTWDHELAEATDPADVQTRVTVELREVAEGTEVVILHEQIRDDEERAGYEMGWNGCLGSLERAFAAEQVR